MQVLQKGMLLQYNQVWQKKGQLTKYLNSTVAVNIDADLDVYYGHGAFYQKSEVLYVHIASTAQSHWHNCWHGTPHTNDPFKSCVKDFADADR